ncbi:MAG: hypothetical protein H7228_04835, partial [Polaromonas sp.]|nr:hypothetical protein [Polaromonas sp.]
MLVTDTPKTTQPKGGLTAIHALWGRAGVDKPSTLRMDAVLRMLRTHFDVDIVIIALADERDEVVKVR